MEMNNMIAECKVSNFTNDEIEKFVSFLWNEFGNKIHNRMKTNRSEDGVYVLGYEDNFKDQIRYYCVDSIIRKLDSIKYENLRNHSN
jgi:hypothetical protein